MKKLATFALLATLSASTFAAEDFYVGGGVGSANIDVKEDGIDFDESDLGFKIFGGVSISDNFAVEANYYDFGSPEDSGVELNGDALGVFAVGILPLHPSVSLFAKAGFLSWDYEGKGNGNSEKDSGNDFAWGLGADFKVVDNLRLRTEYEFAKLDFEDVNADQSFASVSLQLNF